MTCKKGFSLLELLIYMSVLIILTSIISGVFLFISKGRGQAEAFGEVNSNIRFAVEKISQDLYSASSVSSPAAAGETSAVLTVSVSGSDIVYCAVANVLRRQAGGACTESSEAVTNNLTKVDALSFTRLENSNAVLSKTFVSIEINIGVSYNSSSSDWQYSANKKTTIALRQ